MTATEQRLTASIRVDREVSVRIKGRILGIIRARIAELRAKHNDLTSQLVADELDEIVQEINSVIH